jgi:hypothetical protein
LDVAVIGHCVGWQSEHINTCDVIHLWDTSQIVEFLWAFRSLLQDHVARETLLLSRLKVDDIAHRLQKNEDITKVWGGLSETFEPIVGVSDIENIFPQLFTEFVKPWSDGQRDRNYSMLVYGPPGTGKTTIAKNIAAALERRFITVTVSDFLGAGGAQVEARAKAIFQTLQAQRDCVIFFDEIDAFLLDRASTYYFEQDSLFQFLTPGMLTKINDLRSAERSIFIIATNYENRIDPAIKRPGRIDRLYLLLPPNLAKREKIILEVAAKKLSPDELQLWGVSKSEGDEKNKHAILRIQNDFGDKCHSVTKWAKAACLLGYSQIEGRIVQVVRNWKGNASTIGGLDEKIEESLRDCVRSACLEDYLPPVVPQPTNSGRPAVFPAKEFECMVTLVDEVPDGNQMSVSVKFDQLSREAQLALVALQAKRSSSVFLNKFVPEDRRKNELGE